MKIENLSKELDTKTMTAVRGGAISQSDHPVLYQGNWQTQSNNVGSNGGDVTIAQDMSGKNEADVPSFLVGQGLFGFPVY
jgi:hypothetical protein